MQHEKNIKVDAYDFFGYLVPGFIVLMSLIFCHLMLRNMNFHDSIAAVYITLGSINTQQALAIIVAVVLTSYTLGHIIASVSSFVFDKLVTSKILNYPYQHLLFDIKVKQDKESNIFRTLIADIYLTIAFIITLPIDRITVTVGRGLSLTIYWWLAEILLLIFLLILSAGIGQNGNRYLSTPYITYFASLPRYLFMLFECLIKAFTSFDKPLPPDTITLIQDKYKQRFKHDLTKESGSEIFWSMYWYTSSKDVFVRSRIDKWLVLYSFTRNLACSCLLSSLIIVVPEIHADITSKWITYHSATLYIFSIVLTVRYYYLFFGYYTKNILRTFAYLDYNSGDQEKDEK